MPQARTDLDRDTKVDQILVAAERRVRKGGYDAMSVAAISREIGVAQNSIYWYFPTKDELFVAALRRILVGLAGKKPPASGGLVHQVLWATDQMHDLAPLRADLRERAKHAAVAAEYDRELDALVDHLLVDGIEPFVRGGDARLAATTFLAAVEGMFALELKKAERHRAIRFALERLIGVS